MSSHVLLRLVITCHIKSSCSRILLPNLSSESSKFFNYGGGVAPTRFSKPWPCAGIRLGATLSLWRRAHCERVRGPRAHFCDLGIVLRGRLRGSGVLGGVSRACRGHAAGALPWGLGSGRVAHAHDFTRCDLRFAWQVWEFGCIDALGKALDGGSAWQAQ